MYLIFFELSCYFLVLISVISLFSFPIFLKSNMMKVSMNIYNLISSQVTSLYGEVKEKMLVYLYLFLFFLIFVNNIVGNMSNTYSGMSIIFLSLFFSLTIWSSMKVKGLFHNIPKMLIELTPENSPLFLIWLNVFSHFLSSIVSGMILSLRITANLSSGELILDLISWMMSENMFLVIVQILFTILELMISFVQSFIFMNLSSLFYKDLI